MKLPRKIVVLITVLLTAVCVLVVLNFTVGDKKVKHEISHLYGVDDPSFIKSLGVLLGPSIIGGNRFEALNNGEEIFPSMLQAIRSAQKTINFETYIYWSDEIGREFSDALSERAQNGVKVHLLIDLLALVDVRPLVGEERFHFADAEEGSIP